MISKKWKIVLPLIAICVIFASAGASFANNASEKVQDLGKVEVTGSRLAEDITEVPAPAYVITKEEIDDTGARNLSEVLDRIPGVMGLTSASSSMARTQEVMIRGLGSEILLLVDGVPFTNTYGMSGSNGFDLRTIPLDSIERIEVVKGASSALYGSAAAAGVINIITRKGYDKPTGFIKAEGGSGGFFRGTVRGTAVLSDDLRITAGYSKTKETGDVKMRRLTKTDEPAKYDYGTDYNANDYNFRIDKGFWSLVGEWGDFDSRYEYDKDPNVQLNDYSRVSLNYNDGTNTGRIYYRTDNKDSNSGTSDHNKYDSTSMGITFNRKQELFNVPFVYGFDWQKQNGKTYDVIASKQKYDKKRSGFAPYVEASIPLGQANLDLGLRYENWSVDDAENVNEFIPRLSLNWESPSGKLLYFTAGRYFMMPTLSQIFSEYKLYGIEDSPNLKSEQGWTYDIGIKDERAKNPWKLGAFYMDMEDKIVYTGSKGEPAYTNVAEYKAWGFEGQYKFNINDNWSFTPGFAYTHAEEKASSSADWVRSGIPRMDISAFLNYKQDKWRAELAAHYYGDRVVDKKTTGKFAKDDEDIFLVNASVAWDVFENQTLRLTCTNIFDKEFILSSSGYINPERKIIASWECKF